MTLAQAQKTEKNTHQTCQLLIVEDNPGDVYLIREALETAGVRCNLKTFADGEEALSFITEMTSLADVPRPDLILLDLNLPKLDGTEILRAIRGSRITSKIPVLVLTSALTQKEIELLETYGSE
ncbi:MAG: response regulator, partial [Acidobacteriota bacterium]|nr:response regulator [Acidobacteriota bacterium]